MPHLGLACTVLAATESATLSPVGNLQPWPPEGQCQTCPSAPNVPCCTPSWMNLSTPSLCSNTYPKHACCDYCGEGIESCACDEFPCTRKDDTGIDGEPLGSVEEEDSYACCGRCYTFAKCGAVVWNESAKLCVFYDGGEPQIEVAGLQLFSYVNLPPTPAPPESGGDQSVVTAVITAASVVVFLVLAVVVFLVCRQRRSGGGPFVFAGKDMKHGPYVTVDKLGKGAFGTVFLVRDKGTGRTLALKQIHCATKDDIECARQESRMLDEFQGHPSMVEIVDRFFVTSLASNWYESARTNETRLKTVTPSSSSLESSRRHGQSVPLPDQDAYFCIVMELWEGDLHKLLVECRERGGKLPESVLLGIVLQVCQLLHHLHNARLPIIHRDLKPQNILVADGGRRVAVTDFGLARLQDQTYMHTQAGSMPYIAPECFRMHYDFKADMWSLGAVAYAMASLRTQREDVRCLFAEVRDRDFHRGLRREVGGRGYGEPVVELIVSLLQEDPRARPSAAEVITRLGKEIQPFQPRSRSDPRDAPGDDRHIRDPLLQTAV